MQFHPLKIYFNGLKNEKINSVFNKYNSIEKVIIYGSRAKGNYKTGSDIDLTLIGENITYQDLSTIIDDIDQLNTPYLFDISIFHKLN